MVRDFYYQNSYDIVAYTYKADLICPTCILDALPDAWEVDKVEASDIETALHMIAETQDVDYDNETTYDSGEFPKVVFRDQVEDGDVCGECFGKFEDSAYRTKPEPRVHGRHI
jgi:hypothetical protein